MHRTMSTSHRHPILVLAAILFAACATRDDKNAAIVLFNGDGTSPGDVEAIEKILDDNHVAFSTAGSSRLNAMTESDLRRYRLLIMPGGNFMHIGNSLNRAAPANMRSAIQHGLNYLGICAGAFLAGDIPGYGLNLTSGIKFGPYAVWNHGVRKTAVSITDAAGATLDQYWEDGPQLSGWGTVVAKYPDDTPAVVEGSFGDGWVVLSGIHPEAPEKWRRQMTFRTPAAVDHAYALKLIQAALDRRPLPHY